MRHKLSGIQQEVLLKRQANQTRLGIPSLPPANSIKRPALEALAGLVFGVPLGVSLYYVVVVLYYLVFTCLIFVGLAVGSAFHIPDASVQVFLHGLDYGPVIDRILAVLAIIIIFYFTCGAIRQGYRVFAWVQSPLMLSVSLMLFYLTIVHHKPLFPFYEQ